MADKITREQSEFNMAVSYLNRLNALFYSCDNAAINLDAYTWFHSLLAVFRELSTEMKPEEITRWETEVDAINKSMTQHIKTQRNKASSSVPQTLYYQLHKLEMFLRGVLKTAGLQMKTKEDMFKPEEKW